MHITPSQGTLQAFGSSPNTSPPAAHVRQSVTSDQVEQAKPNTTQRVDAAPRTEAPARSDADSRSTVENSARPDRPGSRLNIVV